MFKNVHFPYWTELAVVLAFILIASAFIAVVLRILKTPKEEIQRVARLPLDESTPSDTPSSNNIQP